MVVTGLVMSTSEPERPTVVTATPGFKELLKQSLKEIVEENPELLQLSTPAHRGECSKVVKPWKLAA